jgi:hypothetical protein
MVSRARKNSLLSFRLTTNRKVRPVITMGKGKGVSSLEKRHLAISVRKVLVPTVALHVAAISLRLLRNARLFVLKCTATRQPTRNSNREQLRFPTVA